MPQWYLVLLQRNQIQFPAPTGRLIADPKPSSNLGGHQAGMCCTYIFMQAKHIKKFFKAEIPFGNSLKFMGVRLLNKQEAKFPGFIFCVQCTLCKFVYINTIQLITNHIHVYQ